MFSRQSCGSGLPEVELEAPIRVVLSAESLSRVITNPNLDLSLPDDNVRNLLEGCIGCGGTTDGHRWDGNVESLRSSDAVGLNVYLALLWSQGSRIEGWHDS